MEESRAPKASAGQDRKDTSSQIGHMQMYALADGTGVKGTPLTPVPKQMSSKHASIGPVWVFLSPGDLPASRGSHCPIRQDAHARQGLASGAQTI